MTYQYSYLLSIGCSRHGWTRKDRLVLFGFKCGSGNSAANNGVELFANNNQDEHLSILSAAHYQWPDQDNITPVQSSPIAYPSTPATTAAKI
jgi:hypothetical protein